MLRFPDWPGSEGILMVPKQGVEDLKTFVLFALSGRWIPVLIINKNGRILQNNYLPIVVPFQVENCCQWDQIYHVPSILSKKVRVD